MPATAVPIAIEAGVGAGYRTLEVFQPTLELGQMRAVQAALLDKIGETALGESEADATTMWHEMHIGSDSKDTAHASIHIPLSAICDSSETIRTPNLITYTKLVAGQLGLKHVRYGVRESGRTTNVFVGFSAGLSQADLRWCSENGFVGPSKQKRETEKADINGKVHEDGSVTFLYRVGDLKDGHISHMDGLERARLVHRHMISTVAPNLEEGVVIAPIGVLLQEANHPSLFTSESS